MTINSSASSTDGSPFYNARAKERLADKAVDKRDYKEAVKLLLESLAIRKAAGVADDCAYAQTLDRLAGLYIEENQIADATAALNQAVPMMEACFYPAHGLVAPLLEHQADCLLAEGKAQAAEPILKRAAEISASSVTLENRLALRCLYKLGKVYLALGNAAEAKVTLTKGMKYVDTPLGPVAEFRYQLALAALMLDDTVTARTLLQDAAADFKQRSNYARVGDCSDSLAKICNSTGFAGEADEWMRQSDHYKALAINAPYPHDIFLATLLRA